MKQVSRKKLVIGTALVALLLVVAATGAKAVWNEVSWVFKTQYPSSAYTIADSKEIGSFLYSVEFSPREFEWKGKILRFREAWIEEAVSQSHFLAWFPYWKKLGYYRLCFTIEDEEGIIQSLDDDFLIW